MFYFPFQTGFQHICGMIIWIELGPEQTEAENFAYVDPWANLFACRSLQRIMTTTIARNTMLGMFSKLLHSILHIDK